MTTHHVDIPTTHQASSEWKPITTKSNPIQQKNRYEYHKLRSSQKNYKYKRDIDPNYSIVDIYDSSTITKSNRMKRQFPGPTGGGGPAPTEEPIIEEEDLFDLEFDVRNLKMGTYSHLSNSQGGGNKQGQGEKVVKSINVRGSYKQSIIAVFIQNSHIRSSKSSKG